MLLVHCTTMENAKSIIRDKFMYAPIMHPDRDINFQYREAMYPGFYMTYDTVENLFTVGNPASSKPDTVCIILSTDLLLKPRYHANRYNACGYVDETMTMTAAMFLNRQIRETYTNESEDMPEVIYHVDIPTSYILGIYDPLQRHIDNVRNLTFEEMRALEKEPLDTTLESSEPDYFYRPHAGSMSKYDDMDDMGDDVNDMDDDANNYSQIDMFDSSAKTFEYRTVPIEEFKLIFAATYGTELDDKFLYEPLT